MERVKKIREGDVRAASRLIRNIEDRRLEARQVIKEIFRHTGNAHVVGITGSPGVGKSTLVDGVIEWNRRTGKTIGVLAVDPTSPFTGGAILGDRIRMQRHAEDPGSFVHNNTIVDRIRRRSLHELNDALASYILDPILNQLIMEGEMDRMIDKLLKGETDPVTLAEEAAGKYLQITAD